MNAGPGAVSEIWLSLERRVCAPGRYGLIDCKSWGTPTTKIRTCHVMVLGS